MSTRNIAREVALSNGSVEEHTVGRGEDRALENRPTAERAGHGRLPQDGEVGAAKLGQQLMVNYHKRVWKCHKLAKHNQSRIKHRNLIKTKKMEGLEEAAP